jgi:DNA-binding MarR family transcriptional regulator
MSTSVKESNSQKFATAMVSLVQAIKKETDSCAKLCGVVNEKELTIIVFVGQNKTVKMSEIADNIEAPMSTLTTIVDKLVERGFIRRDHSGEDRRVINVSLTKEGMKGYQKVMGKNKKVAGKALAGLNEKEQELIIKHLNHLAGILGSST